MILIQSQDRHREAENWVLHSARVITEIELTYRIHTEAQNQLLRYVLTDSPEAGPLLQQRLDEARGSVENLRLLAADNEAKFNRAVRMGAISAEYLDELGTVLGLFQAGKRAELIEVLHKGEANKLLDQLRSEIKLFQEDEERLREKRTRALSAAELRNFWYLLIGTLATIWLAGLFGWVINVDIVRRFRALNDKVRAFSQGTTLPPPGPGSDEISRLDHSFHQMATQLEDRKRESEMFIYSVSHDLRGPLVNLQGFSEELRYSSHKAQTILEQPEINAAERETLRGIVENDFAEAINFIRLSVGSLTRVIDGLLKLSRIGRVEYRFTIVPLNQIVSQVLSSLEGAIREKGIEVEVADLPSVHADALAIEQVFSNIIGNAVKYSDKSKRPRIEIGSSGATASDLATIFVRDNGVGIPAEYQSKLFLVFQRFHEELAAGEGIGLAVVKKIIERHGGHVTMDSQSGLGSTFYISLPKLRKVTAGERPQSELYGAVS